LDEYEGEKPSTFQLAAMKTVFDTYIKVYINAGIYILAIPPPWGGGTGKNLKEDFMKKEGKRRKKKQKDKSDKTHVKIPL